MPLTPAERRRSSRKAQTIPVKATWDRGDRHVQVGVKTEMISANGGLLRMKTRPLPNRLTLKNPRTGKVSGATVLYTIDRGEDGWVSVAVALDVPGEEFWGVSLSTPDS